MEEEIRVVGYATEFPVRRQRYSTVSELESISNLLVTDNATVAVSTFRTATDNPLIEQKVNDVIMADVAANKKAGPFDRPPFKFFSVSPIGAVPKKGTNKIRVIHHLSHPPSPTSSSPCRFCGTPTSHGLCPHCGCGGNYEYDNEINVDLRRMHFSRLSMAGTERKTVHTSAAASANSESEKKKCSQWSRQGMETTDGRRQSFPRFTAGPSLTPSRKRSRI